ncbi:hypothetical protein J437_LFUL004564 [Ladona fulva]|uniref:Uncharacterized protein n=1 Tax=Ladona fulva TaxID=123851 RepID=A0A8K0NUL9_LADFU|nr:hypothetical protein J437_LFUL004564 [Ladona fulva]
MFFTHKPYCLNGGNWFVSFCYFHFTPSSPTFLSSLHKHFPKPTFFRRNSVALEERRNAINEKLVRKEKKKGRKKKGEGGSEGESKRKGSIGSTHSEKDLNGCSSASSNQGSSSKRRSSMAEMDAVGNGLAEGQSEGQSEGENGAKTEKKAKAPEEVAAEMEAEERREREAAKKKQRDPPIVFRDAVDVRVEFDALVGFVGHILNPEEQQSLEELHQYMLEDEGSWALSDSFLYFVGRLLNDTSLGTEVRLCILKVLAVAALKDDVILLLHQDRKEHVIMNYAHTVDRLPHDEQLALTLFVANLFENLSSSEWLLYISEWDYNGQMISNIRVTTKVAVNALLSQDETLRDRGSAIVHNLACKEVKTVVNLVVTALKQTSDLLTKYSSKLWQTILYHHRNSRKQILIM